MTFGSAPLDETMLFCVVGLGVLVLLLVFLAIYQQRQAKRAANEKIERLRSESATSTDRPSGSTPFFVGSYHGSNARFFRVYADAGKLLFLLVGPYFVMIDADAARGDSGKHWFVRSLKLLAITLASGAVASVIVMAAVAKAISRNAGGFQGDGHAMVAFVGVIGLLALATVILVPAVLWRLDRRGKELDALPLSRLRELAEVEDRSFAASPDNVPEMTFSLLDQRENFRPSAEIGAVIAFTHASRGKWKIETETTRDTRQAIEMAYAVWGQERVHVEQKLIDRLARTVEVGALPITSLHPGLQPLVAQAQPRVTEEDRRQAEAAEAHRRRVATAPKIGDPGSTFSMNGIGTMVCDGRGIVEWDYWREDSDALLAFCFLGIPIIPYKAVHVSNWQSGADLGLEYQSIPIRWTRGLTASVYLRRLWGVFIAGGILLVLASYFGGRDLTAGIAGLPLAVVAGVAWLDDTRIRVLLAAIGLSLIAGTIVACLRLARSETRHRAIRRLLGRHVVGSSDPAFWRQDLLQKVQTPQRAMGSSTYAAAVAPAMEAGDYRKAMFAARLSAALEDETRGDELTDSILQNEAVQHLVGKIQRKPKEYDQAMPPTRWDPLGMLVV